MTNYNVPAWLIWTTLTSFFFLFVGLLWYIWKYYSFDWTDKILMLHKTGRFSIFRVNIKNYLDSKGFTWDKQAYNISAEAGVLTKRGKVLYCFSEGNPNPMKLKYNTAEWLDSSSLRAVLNNDLVQKILSSNKSDLENGIILLGAIGGIIGGACSAIVLLKVLGAF